MKLFCVLKWSDLESLPRAWQTGIAFQVPLCSPTCCHRLWAAAVQTKQAAQRGKGVSPPSGDKKTLGGLILGHKLIRYHMTGTCPDTLLLFLTVLLRHSMWNVWVCPCTCICGLFQSVLNRAARIIFTEHIRPSHITAFPLPLGQNLNSFGYKTLPNLVSSQYQLLFRSFTRWFL